MFFACLDCPPLCVDYRKWQHLLDKSTIHVVGRWVVAAALLAIYLLRVFYLNAFHIVTYGLGIYLLNLFIGFLSPQVRSVFAERRACSQTTRLCVTHYWTGTCMCVCVV